MISIVIPTYNSEKTIGEVLDALFKEIKRYRKKVEVIVVDDGSKDNTLKIVEKYPVRLFKQKHKGPAAARNLGVKKARGNIVIFLDSDCKVSKNWLKKILEPFKDKRVAGVGVKYKTWNRGSWVGRFVGYEIGQRQERMKKETDYLASYSTAYRKEVLKKVKGFDTRFRMAAAEDNDLSYRIVKEGYKLIFLKNSFVWHKHPESLRVYFKKQFYQALWRVFLYLKWIKEPRVLKGDQYAGLETLSQPFLYLFLFLSLLFSFKLFLILLVISIIIHFPSAFRIIRKGDVKVGILMPFLFFLRGIVWMFGMLTGVFMFLKEKLSELVFHP